MREAASSGKAENAALELLEDRVATQQGKGQIYGGKMIKRFRDRHLSCVPPH